MRRPLTVGEDASTSSASSLRLVLQLFGAPHDRRALLLYGGPYTRALITEMVLIESGIPYELRVVDVLANEHRSPEFLAINPAGWVPALITPEGETLYETPAINLMIAERHGLTDIAPAAGDPARGRFLCGLFYLTGELEPVMKRYFFPHRYVVRKEDASAMKKMAAADALDRLGVVNQRLEAEGPYHLGDRVSLGGHDPGLLGKHLRQSRPAGEDARGPALFGADPRPPEATAEIRRTGGLARRIRRPCRRAGAASREPANWDRMAPIPNSPLEEPMDFRSLLRSEWIAWQLGLVLLAVVATVPERRWAGWASAWWAWRA